MNKNNRNAVFFPRRDNQVLTEAVEKEQQEREWLEGELRAQYEAAEGTDHEMSNLQTFVRKLHTLVEDKSKALEMQKVYGQLRCLEDSEGGGLEGLRIGRYRE